jgi:hypothetical protein
MTHTTSSALNRGHVHAQTRADLLAAFERLERTVGPAAAQDQVEDLALARIRAALAASATPAAVHAIATGIDAALAEIEWTEP